MDAEITRIIPKAAVLQFEEIRASGSHNMLDLQSVQIEADWFGYHALASLTKDDYLLLLRHYSELMQHYGIERMERSDAEMED